MIVQKALSRLGVKGMGDPAPGAGVPSGMSYSSPGFGADGLIRLVPSLGRERAATYLMIYRTNPFVYAATNYIARGIGRLPIHTYGLDSDANKQRIRSDIPQPPGRPVAGVALDRMLSQPVYPSRAAAYGSMMRERLIFGKSIWEVLSDTGVPYALKPIPWRNVAHVEEDGDGGVKWYEVRQGQTYGVGSQKRIVQGISVVHFGLGSDIGDPCGVSLLESCHHTLALHEAVMRHLLSYLGNSARPSGMFEAESAKAAREAKQLITELYTSPENAGKVLVTNAKWQSMSDSPDHAQLVELIKESRVEIAAAFQTPPPILGLLEQAIRANVKEMREQFGRDTIGPWASETEDDFEGQLLPRVPAWSSLFVEFQLAEMLRPDLEARALVYQRMMAFFTIDEIRSFENLPPLKIKGVTDQPWVASGAMPLSTAAKGKQLATGAKTQGSGNGESPQDSGGAGSPSQQQAEAILALTEALDRANGNGHLVAREIT